MRFLLSISLLLYSLLVLAQEEEPPKFTVKGYLKDMISVNHLGDSVLFQNLIHNRVNTAWYPSDHWSVFVEVRTRLISGGFVKSFPNYDKLIDTNNDYLDLSGSWMLGNSSVLNVMADRAYVQWAKDTWEVKLGRQRINWGINLVWNPNDWFNAYSYFDFDYEERPGSDAIRISRYTGVASSVEVAAKMADEVDNFVGAGLWKINKSGYDVQFLAGLAQGDLALGTGWAGNLGLAGFKGEFTYFHKAVETVYNLGYDDMVLWSISVDYSFPSSLYLNGSVLFNSGGSYDPASFFFLQSLRPGTVRTLSPYKWSSFVQTSYQFSPLLFGGLAFIGYPGGDAFFVNPSLTVSVRENLDLDLIGQLFYGENAVGDFTSLLSAGYLRIKWSF